MREKLTQREQDIFDLMLEGTSPKEIGYKLNISYHTVDFHRTKIYRKLGVNSFHELLSMHGQQSTVMIPEEPAALFLHKTEKLLKLLVSATILLLAVSILSVWIFLAKPSAIPEKYTAEAAVNNGDTLTLESFYGSGFDVTMRDGVISQIAGNITLENGTKFTVRTFNTVYLRAQRWTYKNPQTGANNWGENYASKESISLRDIYNGNLDELISEGKIITVRISGTVDIELKNVTIDFQYSPDDNSGWICVGGAITAENNLTPPRYKIGPGAFSKDFFLVKKDMDLEKFPEGEVILEFCESLSWQTDDDKDQYGAFVDGAIPSHIPDGTIMATIRNLTIELVQN